MRTKYSDFYLLTFQLQSLIYRNNMKIFISMSSVDFNGSGNRIYFLFFYFTGDEYAASYSFIGKSFRHYGKGSRHIRQKQIFRLFVPHSSSRTPLVFDLFSSGRHLYDIPASILPPRLLTKTDWASLENMSFWDELNHWRNPIMFDYMVRRKR